MTIAKARTVADLRKKVRAWRGAGLTIGLVPTMGALHQGHLSLAGQIREHCDKIVVSIFVNPAQFGAGEDFDAYPRDEDADCTMLEAVGADLVFLPSVDDIYPEGYSTTISVGSLAECLCGRFRPGHFDGVATVVAKLFLEAGPDAAIFGEKDYQQLQVIRKMVRDLDFPVDILAAPTIREADGLAMSSRNRYLDEAERAIAAALPRVVQEITARAARGGSLRRLEEDGRKALLAAGFSAVDYLEFRDGDDLSMARKAGPKTRLFAAARLGKTRLIDNLPVA